MMKNEALIDLDSTLDRQKKAWLDGNRPRIEDLLRDSSLPSTPDVLLDLIYNEIVVREELGETPSLDEYVSRYSDLEEELELHFEVHQAFQEQLLTDTYRAATTDPMIDFDRLALAEGLALTDYDMISELGRGGMGIVYKARHLRLNRLVALKMFQPGRHPSQRELARFRSEAETIARLHHANIVQIFEIGEEHGLPYLALELAEKGTLQQKLLDMPYPPRGAAELIEILSRAIHHAHENHIIHRDIKPANVLFAKDGTPKITDFGLAKILESEGDRHQDMTRSGEHLGTPRYMSPEQATGKPDQIGPATDVYSLGTLLFECMTGQAPFVSASIVETVDRIRHEEPVSPRRFQRGIPRDLETICLTCLRKDPSRRYHSAHALAEDLRRFLRGEPIQARRTPWWERGWLWCRRHPTTSTLSATGFALLFTGLILFFLFQRAEERRVELLKIEIAALMKEGQSALLRGESLIAKERFLAAREKVQGEPALYDHELGIRGWLDQSERSAFEQIQKQRAVAPSFKERLDDAFILSILSDPRRPESFQAAYDAIASTLEFTVADEPGLPLDRELLLVLKAVVALHEGDSSKAIAALNLEQTLSTRIGFLVRAKVLDKLHRESEADRDRQSANDRTPEMVLESLFRGIDHAMQQDFDSARQDFEEILLREPDHFLARFLQSICFYELHRADEAKVALTACLGQRSRFAWSPLFRGHVYLQKGNMVAAAQDFQVASEMKPNEAVQCQIGQALEKWGRMLKVVPPDQKEAFWKATITTQEGRQSLRDAVLFEKQK